MKTRLCVASYVTVVLATVLFSGVVGRAAAAAESGTTSGTVLESGETLTVKTEQGEEDTFFVQWVKKGEKWAREEMADIALKKALRKGMPVTVKWSVGEQDRKYIEKLIAKGTVTGTVAAPREKGILLVRVEGIDGPMRFVSRWIKREGKWIPDPDEVALMASVETGSTVSVSYELEEHLRINALTVAED